MERYRFSWGWSASIDNINCQPGGEAEEEGHTPRQRLRQLEPSLFWSGQTTSLLASETENEPVRDERGGMMVKAVQIDRYSQRRNGVSMVSGRAAGLGVEDRRGVGGGSGGSRAAGRAAGDGAGRLQHRPRSSGAETSRSRNPSRSSSRELDG